MTEIKVQPPEVSYYLGTIKSLLGRDGFDDLDESVFWTKEVMETMSVDELPEPLKSWGKEATAVLDVISNGDNKLPQPATTYEQKKRLKENFPYGYNKRFNTTFYKKVYTGRMP